VTAENSSSYDFYEQDWVVETYYVEGETVWELWRNIEAPRVLVLNGLAICAARSMFASQCPQRLHIQRSVNQCIVQDGWAWWWSGTEWWEP
jgi:hypothetical protein